jgi:hypothetical protein
MFSQLKTIYDETKAEYRCLRPNMPGTNPQIHEKNNFSEFVIGEMKKHLQTLCPDADYFVLAQNALIALIVQAYQVAACGGHEALLAMKIIEREIRCYMQSLHLEGSVCKFGINPVTNTSCYMDEHSILVVYTAQEDRAFKLWEKKDFNELSNQNFIVMDTWGENFHEYKKFDPSDGVKLACDYFIPETVECTFTFNRCVSNVEWLELASTLFALKEYLNQHFFTFFRSFQRTQGDAKAELDQLNKTFNQKIAQYQARGSREFPVRHWQDDRANNDSEFFVKRWYDDTKTEEFMVKHWQKDEVSMAALINNFSIRKQPEPNEALETIPVETLALVPR